MWFANCKRREKKWYSVILVTINHEDQVICKTQSFGDACFIAKMYDERYKNLKIKESEYRIDIV